MKSPKRLPTYDDQQAARPKSAGILLLVIIGTHLLLAGFYWAHTPFGASPDEGAHARYVETLAKDRTLPIFRASDRENYESHQPPLHYAMAVPLHLLGEASGLENPGELVRLLSMLIGAASIFVIYRAVIAAFPARRDVALACAGFAALLPTHVMLSSSVSNDPLMELVFGLTLMLLALMLQIGLSWPRTLWLGVVLGAGLLTKSTCALLFPISLIAFVLLWRRKVAPGTAAAAHCSVAVVMGLAVGGWWFVRNHMLYGDPLGVSLFRAGFQHTATPQFWLSQGWTWSGYFGLVGVWTFASFWGVFGHMNVFMPWPTYALLAVLWVVSLIGALRAGFRLSRESSDIGNVLIIYLSTVILVASAFVQFNLHFFQAQGRYLYPAMIPMAVFWVLGIQASLPARFRAMWPCVAVGVVVIVQVVALFTCIIPRMPYYT